MSMNKIKGIPLETTASYQALSQLGVQFWNQDRQTAILQFQITRNNYPLALSEENVKVFIALESGDSFLVDDKINFVDEMEGIVSYTIPTDFMRVAKDVTGQVYVTTLDEEEVVVQRQFIFKVSNDLIADLPAEDKIREIKYFADMRAEVAQMMEKLNSDFENMNDYITQVEGTTQEGINELNNLITQKEKAYNDNHEAKMKELNDKGTEYSTKFDEDKQYMDEKFTAFQSSVNGSGLVTTGQSKDWQKYKLTEENSQRIRISDIDPVELNSGFYQMWRMKNAPVGSDDNTRYWNVDITSARDGVKQIVATISSSGKTYKKNVHRDVDSGWKEVAFIDKNNSFETVQGSSNKANTAESNAKLYTDSKVFNLHKTLFEGTAKGVDSIIPLSETLDNFIFLYIYGNFDGGYFAETGDPAGTTDIVIDRTNVIGTDGAYATVFECVIQKSGRTQLKITSDTYHGINTNNGSGPNANRFTINKIVGVRKYADTTQPI